MTDRLRTLIVDDEAAARTRLSLLCADIPRIGLVGAAADGREALEVLDRTAVDLVFLDIEMAGLDGMGLAQLLAERPASPAIVFVTAYERFAVAAFGVDAAGYLLKPVDPELLARTVARLPSTRPPTPTGDWLEHLWAPYRSELRRIPVEDIDWIAGEDDYVRLHTGSQSHLLSARLGDLELRLPPCRFARVHRSSIVQHARIRRLRHLGGGAWALDLASGVTLPVGRTYLEGLRRRIATDQHRQRSSVPYQGADSDEAGDR